MHLQKSPTAAELGDLHIQGGRLREITPAWRRLGGARRVEAVGSDLSEAHGTACEKRQRAGGAKHEGWEKGGRQRFITTVGGLIGGRKRGGWREAL